VDEAFGRYRLIGVIGEGGMGTVYRAHDATMGRDVAIKVLPTEMASEPGYQERFRREAYTAARLTEPHIIPIYEAGDIEGRLYVAMPVIDGIDLHSLLQRDGPMAPRLAVKVIEQIGAALDAAHAAGLVHRDVKPSNALMTANEFVYLIDFGIAHDVSATRLTRAGNIVGTFAYMAPERFSTGTGDARADVYALACVFYECLTGQLPYPGDSLEQQIAGHLTMQVPRPTAVNPAIPVGLDEVITRGMAKDPGQRYQTAQQLTAAAGGALTEAPAPVPIQAGPVPVSWPDVGQFGRPPGPYSAAQPAVSASAVAPGFPVAPQPFIPGGPGWPGGPAPSRGSRKGWIIGAAAAVAVVVAVVAAAIIGRSPGPTPPTAHKTSTSAPNASPSAQPTSTTPMPMVAADRLDSILLTAQEINTLMGAANMQARTGISHGPENAITLSNQDCLGALFALPQPVYQGSGYTAMSGQGLREPESNYRHAVTQAAVSFPSADLALAFVKNSAGKWRACAGQTITFPNNSGGLSQWAIGDMVGDVPTITQLDSRVGIQGYGCQRALSAVWNLVLDVDACSFQVSDQARQIVDKMAAKATQ
jgi:serine/threonine kinase PknH